MFAANRNLDAATFTRRSQSQPNREKSISSDAASASLRTPSPDRCAPSLLSDTLLPSSTASSPATKRLPPSRPHRASSTRHPAPATKPRTPRSSAGPYSGLSSVSNNTSGKDVNETLGRDPRHGKSRKRRHEDNDEPHFTRATRSAKTTEHTASRRKQLRTSTSSKGKHNGRRDGKQKGQRKQTPSCCLCDIDLATLPRRQCIDCPHIHFCIPCSINGRDIHPGHTLQFRRAGEPDREPGPAGVNDAIHDRGPVETPQNREEPDSREIDIHEPTATNTHQGQCCGCKAKLPGLGYECQSCPDLRFCFLCHKSHHHTLTVATVPRLSTPEFDRSGETGDLGASDSHENAQSKQSALTIRRAAEETNQDATTIALTRLTQSMTQAIDGMIALRSSAEELLRLRSHDTRAITLLSTPLADATSVTHSLLDFPIDFSTLNQNKNKDESDDVNGGGSDYEHELHQKRGRLHKRWTNEDRRRLREMRREGLTFTEIGTVLGRTEGAVTQEWRKLSM